ncbi:MAG: glutamine synthetase III [Acholeplasmatales bacterium]|nr:glutamine synthetase III [Acholeplasmatales bacterium]MBR6288689.1 glutamine synthetase III [Acholeplasmatales bacterium]
MEQVTDYFGSLVFDDKTMKSKLSSDVYKSLKKTIQDGKELDISVANSVAQAMKEWAISLGATHFTHWFQPMTGITAEKHDSFISPDSDGRVIMEFKGKELVKGEPDASSFPSGGLRATCEARGYTAWDPTSYAFIKDKCLCIPTAFCSYSGEALDKKTPLLRSMQAINKQALRVLKLFGHTEVTSVKTTVGPEQEYFLIDKDAYLKRPDLIYTGRTLFGAKPPKGQELDDHYFGVIKPRVQEFMNDLNKELWKLGILAKTEHNEVAPAQHELAPIFSTTNIAADNNQLTMEIMQKVAKKHNMVCLLHEKPFKGVNGSGKHNNWSISTNTGLNLLEPGDTPIENAQFLLFLVAVIKAVDEYQDLLRISVASASNDFRLGANEAPPAIISMFVGDDLALVLDSIETGKPLASKGSNSLKIGVDVLPKLPKDATDRNRTSPFAFTGNKFEFRAVGSSESISCANIMLNTAVAEELKKFADILEKSKDFENDLHDLIKKTIIEHKRIIFNGNGYDESWVGEASKRGLLNLKSTPEALPHYLNQKNIDLFTSHEIYSLSEIKARYEIAQEHYTKVVNIEASTALDMINKYYLPSITKFSNFLIESYKNKKDLGLDITYEENTLNIISSSTANIYSLKTKLEKALEYAKTITKIEELSMYLKDNVLTIMSDVRDIIDELELIVSKEYWPFISYGDLLYSVK